MTPAGDAAAAQPGSIELTGTAQVGATVVTPAPTGHWAVTQVETWPGQLAFEAERERRCGRSRTWHTTYLNAFDETGRVTLWAEVPQELAGAELTVEVVELVPKHVAKPKPAKAAAPKASVAVAAKPPKPIPPKPAPKQEKPRPAEAAGATWTPGHWAYESGKGRWVWYDGYWNAPAAVPGAKAEHPGAPPVAGCTWASGYWVWEHFPGRFTWVPGHWNQPPPRQETPGEPPAPGAPWQAGYWVAAGASFEWVPGRWGEPPPLAETPPPPPYQGARWVPGAWLKIKGKYTWSPGFYDRTDRPPPARKAETPPPSPAGGAVWLGGYWRWNTSRSVWDWISGHWELPPGEDYVWVPDPPSQAGVVTSGRWVLRVKVKVKP